VVGRYAMYGEIAAGGMATVHYGRLLGPVGFSRTVAIKRLHPHYAKDPEFVAMFLDEARLAARIRHPNVVQTLDVVARDGELFLVMDYVQGESLSKLARAARQQERPLPVAIVSAILCGALQGLHAAHEATNEHGEPLGIVHRDVSPQNVLVGADGVPRVLDFGVAKAAGRIHTTREGQLKGKLAYMATEQLRADTVDRRTDVYAAGVVLWEALTLQRLFAGESEAVVVTSVLERVVQPPSAIVAGLPAGVDDVVMRALERDPSRRFATAQQMALALEASVSPASNMRVADWIQGLAGDVLAVRAKSVARIESDSGSGKLQPIPSERPLPHGATRAQPETARPPRINDPDERTASQVSSISVSTSALQDRILPRWRRPRVVFAVIALGAVGFVSAALAGMSSRATRPPAAATLPVTAATVVAPPGIPAPAETALAASAAPMPSSPPSSPAPPAVPTAPAAAHAEARPAPARALPSPKPSTAGASAGAAPGASTNCAVKSFVDESGIKHYVKECK
jgi:serine/threonine-protein kinase